MVLKLAQYNIPISDLVLNVDDKKKEIKIEGENGNLEVLHKK